MLILNMYSMSKLYQYRIFPIARLLGPPTILYFPLIFPHARLFGTLLLLGMLEYVWEIFSTQYKILIQSRWGERLC